MSGCGNGCTGHEETGHEETGHERSCGEDKTMIEIDAQQQLGAVDLRIDLKTGSTGVLALFGPSGAGKTSILNWLAGLNQPDRGSIKVNGRVLFDSEKRINLPPEARGLGYVFQEPRLFPHL